MLGKTDHRSFVRRRVIRNRRQGMRRQVIVRKQPVDLRLSFAGLARGAGRRFAPVPSLFQRAARHSPAFLKCGHFPRKFAKNDTIAIVATTV